jgi:geranylgeranyl diphosphate synthase type II
MDKIKAFSRAVEKSIAKVDFPKAPENLYDPLRYFMTLGGKRMRPILALMAAELFGSKAEDAMPSALCVELFHNFTLIHDDIMDAAPVRRAKATVHEKWNENIAILSGDVLMVKAYDQLLEQDPKHLYALLSLFNRTASEVCEGQQMDMDFEERDDVSIEEYIEMIRLKTSVLLGCSLQMGAIVAEASDENKNLIYTFGQELGLAFQIKDDLLDLYGDPEKFGKQIGGDVMANKKTLLYLLALKNASAAQQSEFMTLEANTHLAEKVEKVKALFNELNVPNLAQEYMDKHFQLAMNALEAISVDVAHKKDLQDLSDYLFHRDV